MIAQVARLTGEIDDLLSPTPQRRRAREVAAAQLRHTAIVQRCRKGV